MPEVARADAPSKVNLRLRVLGRLESGYHTLETIFCALSLADTLCVRRAGTGIRLTVEGGIDVGPPEQNLAVRAADHFFRVIGEQPAVRIELTKRIPSAAGLGGGSSDAATTLRALNELYGRPLAPESLLEIAGGLGSDVPFFLGGSPLALGWGRGERLLALESLPRRPVLIVHPGVSVATGEAFDRIAKRRRGGCSLPAISLDSAMLTSWTGIARLAANDFESVVAELVPRLPGIKSVLESHGAKIAMLAGSGACVFGIFSSKQQRDAAAHELATAGYTFWAVETLETVPDVSLL